MIISGHGFGQKFEIRTENGVRLIKNAKDPVPREGAYLEPTLTEDLRIGDTGVPADSAFSALYSFLVDDEEDIIALDTKDMCFKVFDKNGHFVRRFGRRGQGPDEIQRPMGMMLYRGKDIVILDQGNNRVTFYSKEGACFKRIIIKKTAAFITAMDSRGNFYGSAFSFAELVKLNLIKFDQELDTVATIASLKMPAEKDIPPAELMERFYFQVGKDDSLYWGSNFKYEINVTGPDGKLTKMISRAAEPEKVTRAFLMRELKKRYPNQTIPESLQIPAHFPKNLPFFNSFVCDDEGRIFVKTQESDGSSRIHYDVFDAEGIYIARFKHPENEDILAIKNNKAYAMVKESESGNPIIKRYRIEWKRTNVGR
jgi:hypothetical protein